ncbi:hypothetical protein ES705_50500 [subsurface metagenome]
MNSEGLLHRKISIDGIDPDLFIQFKLCLIQQSMTMRSAVISLIEGFVESAQADAKKKRSR